MSDEAAAALAELTPVITHGILTAPDLGDPEWDSYAMAVEVSGNRVALTAYRYTASGPPVPCEGPDDTYVYWVLRERTRGADGAMWDVVLVRIHRDTPNLAMTFLSGPDAAMFRIAPRNMAHIAESLRPRPDDFAGG